MRIVLDMQGAQSASRFRGIGRYTMGLAQAIVRERGEHEVLLALNGLLLDSIDPICAAFEGLLPRENVRVWRAPGPVHEHDAANRWRRESAELVREAFLASLKPDVVHVFSLFEGYGDEAVTSIGRFAHSFATSVTLYDLIPLINPDPELKGNQPYMDYYQRKITGLKRADVLLAISESSRMEAVSALGSNEAEVVNVSCAADERFRPIDCSAEQSAALCSRHGIRRPFILYVGAADERKNLVRLIEAYASLPPELRDLYQLVIAGVSDESQRVALQRVALAARLPAGALCLAGELSDDDLVALYNRCHVFVFPSLHEGFGLPALEAMACGAVVIASNTSSLPEVVGCEEALFDPRSASSMTATLAKALRDDAFRERMRRHARVQAQKFSWQASAQRAVAAFERLHRNRHASVANTPALRTRLGRRLRMAFVSPLPPERTGIADYSVELLPELARYYDIDVVAPQGSVSDVWVRANCPLRSPAWFRAHASRYDRVLYQVGNSPFHSHMFDLLAEVPGAVVLHDFYLSSVLSYDETQAGRGPVWTQALLDAHGYTAVRERFSRPEQDIVDKYPCSLGVLRNALGVIVHSEASRALVRQWYGDPCSGKVEVIQHLRAVAGNRDVDEARQHCRRTLGVADDAFLVCSFGMLAPTKLNHRLLAAWLASPLAQEPRCHLVFVGENHGGDYGAALLASMAACSAGARIRITGWASAETFQSYLLSADLAVQLRTTSRGETSGTVLDCMAHGVPTIVNAHGSMRELSRDAVCMLPDEFTDTELVDALTRLHSDQVLRNRLGHAARQRIASRHSPAQCAQHYAMRIESAYAAQVESPLALTQAVAQLDAAPVDAAAWYNLARAVALNHPQAMPVRHLLVDVTATARHDLKTGIERVARALSLEMLSNPPPGYQVIPVCLSDVGGQWHYRHAHGFAAQLLGIPADGLLDEPVECSHGDILLTLDLAGHALVHAERASFYRDLRHAGVRVYCLLHDLLPIKLPQCFPQGTDVHFAEWLAAVARLADGVVAVSQSVADDFAEWLQQHGEPRAKACGLSWSHSGADYMSTAPSDGLPGDADRTLARIRQVPSFLMVGTIEPRKGHLQTIAGFDALWAQGVDVNLVIVGKEGWVGLPDGQRRTIPTIVTTLRKHSQLGKRLFWLEGISDEYLERVYDTSACLIAASEDEGFGLPLIEAAQHKLPILARDIPVFREVAGEHAYYFSGDKAGDLALAVQAWLKLHAEGRVPTSETKPWLTWKQSTERLLQIILDDEWEMRI